MAAVVQVDPNEVRAAASRWQMIGADHGQAAAATSAFQARIGVTAATSQGAANAFETQDTKVGVDAIKDALSSVSSMIGMASRSIGSLNAVTSMLGTLTSTAVSTSSGLVNNLTGTLSHAGSPTHAALTPEPNDHAPQSGPLGAAPLSGPTYTPTPPAPIDQPPKGSGIEVVTI
jgi:hypothetical protein